jgi:superfamily II DNA or RNA helicase
MNIKPFSEVSIADGSSPGEGIDTIQEIYNPALSNCIKHQRLTFSFSSNALLELANGIEALIDNGGSIDLVIGQPVSEKEEKSIYIGKKDAMKGGGYDDLCLLRLKKLFKEIEEIDDINKKEGLPFKFGLLTNLIGSGKLNIKFSFKKERLNNPAAPGIQHLKSCIFYGANDEVIVWEGSANFSRNALRESAESVSVFKSWDIETGYKRHAERIIRTFERFWSHDVDLKDWKTVDVPSKFYTLFAQKFPSSNTKKNLYDHTIKDINNSDDQQISHSDNALKINLYTHQKDVIDNWYNNNCSGLVEHATGSGKSFTGIFAIKKFFEERDGSNAIIIVPGKILLNQWMEDVKKILPEAIIFLVGGSINPKWRDNLHIHTKTQDKKQVIIAVRASASKKDFFDRVTCGKHLMLLADEVHTLGANESKQLLNLDVGAKMGLSATVDRSNDPEGTKRIRDYFGDRLEPVYGIKEAIDDGRLVKYYYHPQKVLLTASEEDEWIRLSKEISQKVAAFMSKNNIKKTSFPRSIKMLLIQRAAIAKEAANKIALAVEIIKDKFDEDNAQRWLIYCQNKAQLEHLGSELGKHNIEYYKYFSDLPEDGKIKSLDLFAKNGGIMLSIKCLDEGVDIPAADHALILASSSNRREYIQRRGRVLRKDKDNYAKRAYIFDLITVSVNTKAESIKSLVRTEVIRGLEFSTNAENEHISSNFLNNILIDFDLSEDKNMHSLDEFENDEI